MKPVPEAVKPLIGAGVCGVTALFFPQVLFFGYDTLSALLADNGYFSLPVLLALLFIKPLCTAICLGSGLVGGTVAPSLFLGAVVGASFQKLSVLALASVASVPLPFALPDIVFAGTPAYALLGMASVLGGILRAPLTSSLLLFELTRDYKICVASMISAGIASAVANYDGGDFEEAAVAKPEATGAGPAMLHATEAGAKVTVAASTGTDEVGIVPTATFNGGANDAVVAAAAATVTFAPASVACSMAGPAPVASGFATAASSKSPPS
jgi:hypothetical protein